jgi:cysteine-rich repeat protein
VNTPEGHRWQTFPVPLKGRRFGTRLCIAGFAVVVSAAAGQLHGGEPATLKTDVDQLRNALGGQAAISLDRATGTVSFLRFGPDSTVARSAGTSSRRERTMAFLAEFGNAFGLRDASTELDLVSETTDQFGMSHLRYRQICRGVPVFGSDFRSHFDRAGRLVTISASTVPIDDLDPVAGVEPSRAAGIAETTVARSGTNRGPVTGLSALDPKLVVFRTGMVQGVPGRNHLAYWIEVADDRRSVREFVFVDAHTGKVLDHYSGIYHDLDREIYNGGLAPEYLVWEEGDDLPYTGADQDGINDLVDFAEDSYNLFLTMSNGSHPSFDGADSTMLSVFDDPALFCFFGPNASWNGAWTAYCEGTTADDVVAHEWTHGYTEYTQGLIYEWQPGALNESYSDIFGEVVDRLNGAGGDLPDAARAADGSACSVYHPSLPGTDDSVRWLIGEDAYAFLGAIRDMWRPECFDNPGRVSSNDYWCSSDDGGGVHSNSGVPNHAFALLVDGGTYNSQTISGIGLTKAAHIYWYAMTTYQGPVTDFADHADALEASCAALVGINLPTLSTDTSTSSLSGITIATSDCDELSKAIAAVELRSEPVQCGFEPILEHDPPALCAGLGAKQTFSFTDWETGLGGWAAGTRSVTSPGTFDTPDWAVVGALPAERPGMAAFVENYQGGDCDTDVESGVLYLESPEITIPAGTEVGRVAINHWIATEALIDGGNLKLSVNGGAFTLIPQAALDVGPYNETIAVITPLLELNDNPLAGEDAFSGTDGGQPSGSWGASYVSLYGLAAAGDTIKLRFEFGVDGCGGVEGWYVDEVEFYSCADELPPSDCGNGVLDEGEVCDDGNAVNEDGCTNTCQVETGWRCTVPTAPAAIADHSFEAGTPNPYWDEASDNFGSPLCNFTDCYADRAEDGEWYAWFGGSYLPEESSLGQSITVPEANQTLKFHLTIDACDTSADYLEVLIDDNQVWSVNGSSPICGLVVGEYQLVDISGYADGGSHALSFHCETFGVGGSFSNFFVDVVSLPGEPSVCTFDPTLIFADGFELGDTTTWTSTVP